MKKVVKGPKLAITICTKDQYKDIIGIHLQSPDTHYLRDALLTAERDGFTVVFCHYETVGTARYKIPYDVLNTLVILSQEKLARVSFTHPAA